MGGNATFNGRSADKLEVKNQKTRDLILDRIAHLYVGINRLVAGGNGHWLWDPRHFVEDFTAGSTTHLFDPTISTEQIVMHKPVFGDIDLQMDLNRADDVLRAFESTKAIGSFDLVGYHKSVDTIVTMWYDREMRKNIQVDLELVEFENGLPTQWSKFCRSSSWEDVQMGIKGFAHKYIFRALTAIGLQVATVKMKTKDKVTSITPWVFSPKGLREKYEWYDEEFVWREIDTAQSVFIRDIEQIFMHFFSKPDGYYTEPFPEELEWMWSYKGVCALISDKIPRSDHTAVVKGMAHLLWGNGSQRLVKDDPVADMKIKMRAFEYLLEELYLRIETEHAIQIAKYYSES